MAIQPITDIFFSDNIALGLKCFEEGMFHPQDTRGVCTTWRAFTHAWENHCLRKLGERYAALYDFKEVKALLDQKSDQVAEKVKQIVISYRRCVESHPKYDQQFKGALNSLSPICSEYFKKLHHFIKDAELVDSFCAISYEIPEKIKNLSFQQQPLLQEVKEELRQRLLIARCMFNEGGSNYLTEKKIDVKSFVALSEEQTKEIQKWLDDKSLDFFQYNERLLQAIGMTFDSSQQFSTQEFREQLQTSAIKEKLLTITKLRIADGTNDLPPEIFQCTNLEKLVLSHNSPMPTLPPEIEKLKNLKSLKICLNNLIKIPVQLAKLDKLTYLDINSAFYSFEELPVELFNLTNLTSLNTMCLPIKKLPKQISQLQSLETLQIIESKSALMLPVEMGRLTSLKTLRINEISPASIPLIVFSPIGELIRSQVSQQHMLDGLALYDQYLECENAPFEEKFSSQVLGKAGELDLHRVKEALEAQFKLEIEKLGAKAEGTRGFYWHIWDLDGRPLGIAPIAYGREHALAFYQHTALAIARAKKRS